MSQHASLVSRPGPLDKALFGAGLQCAKRLYKDYHFPDQMPSSPPSRVAMAEIGVRLVLLARQAFPVNFQCDADFARAAAETAERMAARKPVALFDAAFRCREVDVRCDVVIPRADGELDVFEVKSGTKVKTRYVKDVALQVYAIEQSGARVHSATVLHLNARYRHRGGSNYPVHELFKYVDVTEKVRKQLDRVADQVERFRRVLQDPAALELPTGTWCYTPFLCGYLAECRAEGPDHPLLDLPELTREQEQSLHQAGIESVEQLDSKSKLLSRAQRRALRALDAQGLVTEPFVKQELRDVEFPLHFVSLTSMLEVLPTTENGHPWQQVPFQWSNTTLHGNGQRQTASFLADGRGDPRPQLLATLAEIAKGPGTLVTFGIDIDQRLRSMLDELPAHKAEARALLHMPRFDLGQLVRAGVYHHAFGGSFEMPAVHAALLGGGGRQDLEVQDDFEACMAYQRLLNSRTRAATRHKLSAQLEAYALWRSDALADIYTHLLKATAA